MFFDWLLILGVVSAFVCLASYQLLVGFELKIKMMPVYLIYLITSVVLINGAMSGRDIYLINPNLLLVERSLPTLLEWYSRIANWLVFALGALAIFMSSWAGGEKNSKNTNQFFYALLIFYITNHISYGFFGYSKGFAFNALYPMVAFWGIWLCASRLSIDCIYQHFLNCIALVLITSFFVLLYQPNVVLQGGYESIIPGIHFRFWGIASHANALGALLGFFLVFSVCGSHVKSRFEYVVMVAAMVALIFSQSKTAILALVVSLLVVYVYRKMVLNEHMQCFRDPLKRFLIYFSLLVLLVLLAFLFSKINYSFATSSNNLDAESFTGRSQIWLLALDMWLKNILFGYGPEIWSLPFRVQINMLFAVSAHNQLLQSLSGAGLLGGIAFLIYLIVGFVSAIKLLAYTRGLSVGLFVFMLMRSLTESNYMLGLFSSDGLVHCVYFTYMLVALESFSRKSGQ